jgi:predicted nucleotidyltransferase
VDLRGVVLPLASDLIGLTAFDQYEDRATDTVLYSFGKLIRLLLRSSPGILELLGLDRDQYLVLTDAGRELIDRKALFLSRQAGDTFGAFARAQMKRLLNAQARDRLPQAEREEHILESVNRALEDFNRRCGEEGTKARLYIGEAVTEGLEKEIFLDADFRHYPLRRYNELMNTLHSVVRDYDKVGKRNHKKDDNHLNKHAMHLVRLFMMGIDILEKEEIRTHRPESDLKLLRRIRNGDYMQDNVLIPDFFEILTDYERRFHEAEVHSMLPDHPDMKAVGDFVESINRRVVTGEIG